MATLGQQISALIDQQDALLAATSDPVQADKIKVRREELDEQLDDVIDISWNQNDPGYIKVVDELSKATKALKDARKGLQEIDTVLKIIDTVVSDLASLIATFK
jgi:archaellum component FlaC